MNWSPTPPSAPGYYWFRAGPGMAPRVVAVPAGADPASLPTGEWSGPLELADGEVMPVVPLPPPDPGKAETRPG
jgi:hypothetical protein